MVEARRGVLSDIEQAIASVRAVVLLLLVIVSTAFLGSGRTSASSVVEVVLVVLGAAMVSHLWRRRGPRREGGDWGGAALHGLETVWYVLAVGVFGSTVPQAAWVVLVIPVVIASIRLADRAVLATWLIEAGLYSLVVERWWPERVGVSGEGLVERIGLLLGVAACIALLSRWMREGWRDQIDLTSAAEARGARLATIEAATREMRASGSTGLLDVCAAGVVGLGFGAGIAVVEGEAIAVAGDGGLVPRNGLALDVGVGEVQVVEWSSGVDRELFSASAFEPISGSVVSGWSRSTIDDALAGALGDLVANAGGAMEASLHLEQARLEARRDPLTRLANRAELARVMDLGLSYDEPMAVVFIDLDHFKPVNDTYGHAVGDALLEAISARLGSIVDGRGVLARYGGDEFVAVFPSIGRREAAEFAERIRVALAQPFPIEGHVVQVSGSIGLFAPDRPVHPTQALRLADEAAYGAKEAGRNRVHVATPPTAPPLQPTQGPAPLTGSR